MISWVESTSAAVSSSTQRARTNHSESSSSRTFTGVSDSATVTLTESSFFNSTQVILLSGSFENYATTMFSSVSRSTSRRFSDFPLVTSSELTSVFTHITTWANTFTSQSAQITISRSRPLEPPVSYSVGTFFQSTTRPTKSIQTSTLATKSQAYAITQSTSNTVSAASAVTTFTFATTTLLTQTEYSDVLYNTIYQAETQLPTSREVLWVAATDQEIEPFAVASQHATSVTRTTQFAETGVISVEATTRPSAFSLWRDTITNASAGQTVSLTISATSNSPNTVANYAVFPPLTSTALVSMISTTQAVSQFTNAPSALEVIEYGQSVTRKQWHTTANTQQVNFPDAGHQTIHRRWTSRVVTASTQNKYVTDALISGTSATSGNSETIVGRTTEKASFSSNFSAGGQSLKLASRATFTTSFGHGAGITRFNERGAAIGSAQSGFALTANAPFTISGLGTDYTALAKISLTTAFPIYRAIQNGNQAYSLSVYGESVSISEQSGTASTSTSLLMGVAGSTAYLQKGNSGLLVQAPGTNVWEVLPGAYETGNNSSKGAITTIGGVESTVVPLSAEGFASTHWTPLSFIVPSTHTGSLVLWAAERNTGTYPN